MGDGILKLLLGYQMYKPLVDKMLSDAGIGDLSDLTDTIGGLTGQAVSHGTAAPSSPPPANRALKKSAAETEDPVQ